MLANLVQIVMGGGVGYIFMVVSLTDAYQKCMSDAPSMLDYLKKEEYRLSMGVRLYKKAVNIKTP